MVFQIQMTRRNDTLPLTRDYMVETARVLAHEAAPPKQRRRRKA